MVAVVGTTFVAILSNQGRLHKEYFYSTVLFLQRHSVAILSNQGRLHKENYIENKKIAGIGVAILSNQGRLHKGLYKPEHGPKMIVVFVAILSNQGRLHKEHIKQ